ncbi:cytochrome P450 [Longispora albida]|uniref:cytochrome P450 n=1 Tax=Longispora albida TaxID=203523 RepID=UPI0003631548|nr:cytochrome P450 [Longispora albida]
MTTAVPLLPAMPQLWSDPAAGLARLGRQAGPVVARLGPRLAKTFLVTDPDHVQYVLRGNPGNYAREGLMWDQLQRLEGNGLAGEGPEWDRSRRLVQKMFTGPYLGSVMGLLTDAIGQAVDELPDDREVDLTEAMTRIIHRALLVAFFGNRITLPEAEQLGRSISGALSALGSRLVLSFMPQWFPLPGDLQFRAALRTIDAIIYPLVEAARREPGDDFVSRLCRARDEYGGGLTDQQIRDDVVSMFVAGSETIGHTLSWFWILLDHHPAVAERVAAEAITAADPRSMQYTWMVLQETLRIYPGSWMIPRKAREADTIAGVAIPAGANIVLTPFLTHRLPHLWPDPEVFDPERFAPDKQRHQFAWYPFGEGVHKCLGQRLSIMEAQMVVSAMLRRFRVSVPGSESIRADRALSLRPKGFVPLVLERRA